MYTEVEEEEEKKEIKYRISVTNTEGKPVEETKKPATCEATSNR